MLPCCPIGRSTVPVFSAALVAYLATYEATACSVISEPSPNAFTGRTSSWVPQRKVRAGCPSAAGTETEV